MYQTRRFVQVWSLSEQNEVLRMLNVKLTIIVLYFYMYFIRKISVGEALLTTLPNPWNSLSRIWSSYHFFIFFIWIFDLDPALTLFNGSMLSVAGFASRQAGSQACPQPEGSHQFQLQLLAVRGPRSTTAVTGILFTLTSILHFLQDGRHCLHD